jgi:hypothetical protein
METRVAYEQQKLPRFMQNMIEAGTLKLSEYQHTGLDEQHRHPKPSLEMNCDSTFAVDLGPRKRDGFT